MSHGFKQPKCRTLHFTLLKPIFVVVLAQFSSSLEAYWHEVIHWIGILTNQNIIINELLLLSLLLLEFTGGNENLANKELTANLMLKMFHYRYL